MALEARANAGRALGREAAVGGETGRIDRICSQLLAAAAAWPETSPQPYVGQPFKVLIVGVLSTRSREETTSRAAAALFELADHPAGLLQLNRSVIRRAIDPVAYPNRKTDAIRSLCEQIMANGGRVPSTIDELTRLRGVGPKVAALTLQAGFGFDDQICVDTHVFRISKRLGVIPASISIAETATALKAKLPRPYWPRWNALMVSLGRLICTPRKPRCIHCPVGVLCPRIGLATSAQMHLDSELPRNR
jgi:endonuclease-3